MPVYVTDGSEGRETAPAGPVQGVLADVFDIGLLDRGNFGPKLSIALVWEIKAMRQNGSRFILREELTASLNTKSNLRKRVEGLLGRKLQSDEEKKFDLESLVGSNAILTVAHNVASTGKVYANVVSVGPVLQDMKPITVQDYKRTEDQGRTDDISDEVPF